MNAAVRSFPVSSMMVDSSTCRRSQTTVVHSSFDHALEMVSLVGYHKTYKVIVFHEYQMLVSCLALGVPAHEQMV
eukprot:977039-Karenia_brevis.AAC.1